MNLTFVQTVYRSNYLFIELSDDRYVELSNSRELPAFIFVDMKRTGTSSHYRNHTILIQNIRVFQRQLQI